MMNTSLNNFATIIDNYAELSSILWKIVYKNLISMNNYSYEPE